MNFYFNGLRHYKITLTTNKISSVSIYYYTKNISDHSTTTVCDTTITEKDTQESRHIRHTLHFTSKECGVRRPFSVPATKSKRPHRPCH